jgi:hypothetical protein
MGTCRYFGTDSPMMRVAEVATDDVFPPDLAVPQLARNLHCLRVKARSEGTCNMLRTTQRKLGTLWCTLMHESLSWPIHGKYQCRTCGRQYPVRWAEESGGFSAHALGAQPAVIHHPRVATFLP